MATAIKMPQLGLTMTEGTINRWLKNVGDAVKAGDVVAEIETDKIAGEVQSPADGVLRIISAREGEVIPVTGLLGYVGAEGEQIDVSGGEKTDRSSAPTAIAPASTVPAATPAAEERVKATPIARKLASDLGVDLASLTGSGPGGRIVEADVRKAAEQAQRIPAAAAQPAAAPPAVAAVSPAATAGPVAPSSAPPIAEERRVRERIPLTGMRRTIADRMLRSLQQSAQLTLGTEVDATALTRARQELVADAKAAGAEAVPTYTDLLVKIVARALREYPVVNATISGNEIVLLDDINVGVAVALETGLVVPVIRQVDRLALAEISAQLRRLASAAREGKLTMHDVTDGTFTITNLGMFDIDFFTPIVNPPESAILGVGRIVEKVVPSGDGTANRPTMALSLTFDHRVFDGAPAARFLQRVKRLVENPLLAL